MGRCAGIPIELDVMFHLIVFPSKQAQDELIEHIDNKPGFYRVRNSPECVEFIPTYIRHRFADVVHSTASCRYISGSAVKERVEEVLRLRDEDKQIIKTVAQLLGVEMSDVTAGYTSEINGPAVTISLQFKVKDGPQLLAEADGVSCAKLPEWPIGKEEFRQRERTSNYPSIQLVNDIIKGGVHIVPKMTASGCDPEEWRLSFSVS